MSDQTPRSEEPRQVSPEAERARALAEVMRDQEMRARAHVRAEVRRAQRSRLRRRALVALWIGIAYVWLANPPWLRIESPPPQPLSEEATALRLNVFLQAQQIEAYRAQRGRLPYILEEVGPPFPGMEYRRRDSRTYEVEGAAARVRIRYDSQRSPLDFVGSAAELLVPAREEGS